MDVTDNHSAGYLQLVDRGILSLDTPLAQYSTELASATSRVLVRFDESGEPVFEDAKTQVTLQMMLNQTSGFGQEMSEKIRQWKSWTPKGRGWVNSCKIVSIRSSVRHWNERLI